jgi:hypothetical protein
LLLVIQRSKKVLFSTLLEYWNIILIWPNVMESLLANAGWIGNS